MKNFVQPGDSLEFTAPENVTSGTPILLGNVLVVPTVDAASGDRFNALMRGVITYAKAGSQAWAQGELVYWDGAVFTTGGGFLAGFATKAVGGGANDTIGELYLDGIPKDDNT